MQELFITLTQIQVKSNAGAALLTPRLYLITFFSRSSIFISSFNEDELLLLSEY